MEFFSCRAVFLLAAWIISVSAQVPEKIVFPDVFSAEVEVDLVTGKEESDVSLYFDRTRNVVALHYVSQKELSIDIYDFGNNRLLAITNKINCEVSEINEENSLFFPYDENKETGKKYLRSAKELFRFPDSPPKYRQTEDGVPLHIYTVTMDLPFYYRKNCTVKYMFNDKSFITANCEYDRCNSTLMGLSIDCPDDGGDAGPINQLFRFFRFENYIPDDSVFKIPPGVYCNLTDSRPFPRLPDIFRFSYGVTKVPLYIKDEANRFTINKESITFVKDEVVAVDRYRNGKLYTRKICDITHGFGYSINASDISCKYLPCVSHLDFEDTSQLPNLLFKEEIENEERPVYTGNRSSDGILYDVWASFEKKDSFHIIRDLYFMQTSALDGDPRLQLSHIKEYTYEKNSKTKNYELIQITDTTVYRFSYTRDWEYLDLSPCYKLKNWKKEFEIQLSAPNSNASSISPGFPFYKQFMVALSTKLASLAGISMTRLTEIKPVPGSQPFTLRGAILEDPVKLGLTNTSSVKEKSLAEAFTAVQQMVEKSKFTFDVSSGDNKPLPVTFKVNVFRALQPQAEDQDDEVTYTRGAMAGLGVTTLFIGLIIGGVLVLIHAKKTRS